MRLTNRSAKRWYSVTDNFGCAFERRTIEMTILTGHNDGSDSLGSRGYYWNRNNAWIWPEGVVKYAA